MYKQRQRQIAQGLKALQDETSSYTRDSYLKLKKMQDIYFSRTTIKYSSEERQIIEYYLNALIHKFHMATLALEQLWALSYDKRDNIFETIEQSLDRLTVNESEYALISFTFDTFLFHSRTYIDFFMLYICFILKTGHEGSISQSKFQKALDKASEPQLSIKASQVRDFFAKSVYGEYDGKSFDVCNWGELITSLRDKIAHRDIIRPSFQSKESLAKTILFDWPMIRNITYDRFHQYMQNGMYMLMQDISTILFDREWIPGPYKAGMFDQ
jgi:hypothetical protein